MYSFEMQSRSSWWSQSGKLLCKYAEQMHDAPHMIEYNAGGASNVHIKFLKCSQI